MNMTGGRWFQIRQYLFCFSLLGTGFMVGCASPSNELNLTNATAEQLTASDEPDARKRARIRLELAVGYFEQGQTTIALDELKQSIASDPTYGDAYSLRGLIYMRLNDFRIAEDSFKKSLGINQKDSNVLHNLGWLYCQQARYPESMQFFSQALLNVQYLERAKTYRAQGLCQVRAGLKELAEASLLKSYESDPVNPVTGYNLAILLFERGDYSRARFYIRRLNNSELANSESLWLGVKIENNLNNTDSVLQLASQLIKRFPQSREASAYQRGSFNE
jgi:type IV pilus assembly protein PilF